MLVKDVVSKTTQFLKEKGSESPRLDSELLISAALKWDRMKIYLNYDYPLSESELSSCREFVRRRAQGEPVAYILGRKDFYKNSFTVSPAVLVPRPETELLVDETCAWIKSHNLVEAVGDETLSPEESSPAAAKIVDLGTGSGCIGLSLLSEIPDAKLVAVDISEAAAEVAKTNAQNLGLSDRATFLVKNAGELSLQDLSRFFSGPADVVVANPPYIAVDDPDVANNVKLHEPAAALFSDDSGLAHIKAWSQVAAKILRPGGWVMFEIGHEQGAQTKTIFESTESFANITIKKDLSGKDRFVFATRIEER